MDKIGCLLVIISLFLFLIGVITGLTHGYLRQSGLLITIAYVTFGIGLIMWLLAWFGTD